MRNSLWDKQARAAHALWILYGKNLKEIIDIEIIDSDKDMLSIYISKCLDEYEEL